MWVWSIVFIVGLLFLIVNGWALVELHKADPLFDKAYLLLERMTEIRENYTESTYDEFMEVSKELDEIGSQIDRVHARVKNYSFLRFWEKC